MKDYALIAQEYIARVTSGEEVVCRKVRLSVERHLHDLARAEAGNPDFPYFFDYRAGARVCRLFEMVQPSKWPTKMKMSPWMVTVTMILFGWKMTETAETGTEEDGTPILINPRRFRQVYFRWPRKTGKSAYLSVLGTNALVADDERGAEVYSAALTEDQARRVFDEAVEMRNGTPAIRRETRTEGSALVKALHWFNKQGQKSIFRPLSRDKENMEGLNVHFAACDEVHKWKNRGAWDVLRYGMRARIQPMIVAITTAPSADDTTSICNALENYAAKVLDGIIPDERFFAWILEIDPELKNAAGEVIQEADRWDDESKWIKACPNLGVTIKLEDMRQEALEAANDPESLNAFKRYSLNIRVDAQEQVIPTADWDNCARVESTGGYPPEVQAIVARLNPILNLTRPLTPQELRAQSLLRLKGRICFGALDLASTGDTSSLVLVFPPMKDGEVWQLLPFFWIPEENIASRVRKDQVPYDLWREQGFLVTTPGHVTDYDYITDAILRCSQTFDLRELAYDAALASGLINKVLAGTKKPDGSVDVPGLRKERVVKFAQTMMNYSQPCGDFVRAIARKELTHDGDPVMRWQITNLRWLKNHSGLFMPDKLRSTDKIDGVAAAIMAFGRGTHPDNAKLLKPKPQVIML